MGRLQKPGRFSIFRGHRCTYVLDSGVETGAEAVLRVGAPAISSRVERAGQGYEPGSTGEERNNCAFPLFCAGPGRRYAGTLSGLEAG